MWIALSSARSRPRLCSQPPASQARAVLSAAAALLALALAGPAAAAPTEHHPPSGSYDCLTTMGSMLFPFGTLQIDGDTYRYGPVGAPLSEPAPFRIGADGQIAWGGEMGALTEPPSRITQSHVERGPDYVSVILRYEPEPDGYTFVMGCRRSIR